MSRHQDALRAAEQEAVNACVALAKAHSAGVDAATLCGRESVEYQRATLVMGFRLSTCVIVGSLIDALRKAACGACDGEGILQVITIDGVGFTTQICRACDGSGRDPNAPPTIRETVLRSE